MFSVFAAYEIVFRRLPAPRFLQSIRSTPRLARFPPWPYRAARPEGAPVS